MELPGEEAFYRRIRFDDVLHDDGLCGWLDEKNLGNLSLHPCGHFPGLHVAGFLPLNPLGIASDTAGWRPRMSNRPH